MAITQSTNGILTCNSVTRSWFVLPNLIAYGCGDGNILDGDSTIKTWTTSSITRRAYTWNSKNIWDYTGSRYAYKFTSATSSMIQNLPEMLNGEKFYFSCWYSWTAKPTGRYASSVTAYIRPSGSSVTGTSIFTTSISSSSSDDMINTAHFYSTVFTMNTTRSTPEINITSGSRNTASTQFWITRMILIRVPTNYASFHDMSNSDIKNWCDNHIREHRTYIGNGLNSNLYMPIFKTNANWYSYSKENYGDLTSGGTPEYFRECYLEMVTKSASEAYLYSDSTLTLTQSKYYYAQIYGTPLTSGDSKTCDWYFPIAEPNLTNNIPLTSHDGPKYVTDLEWQIISGYGLRNSWSTASSQQCRFDLNNTTGYPTVCFSYWGLMINVDNVLTKYNTDKGTSLSTSSTGINKSFFDCWVDGYSQPIIHLHDPDACEIIYKTNYDIVCNDVIVDPTINSIYFDENAIIHCKSLVTNAPLI